MCYANNPGTVAPQDRVLGLELCVFTALWMFSGTCVFEGRVLLRLHSFPETDVFRLLCFPKLGALRDVRFQVSVFSGTCEHLRFYILEFCMFTASSLILIGWMEEHRLAALPLLAVTDSSWCEM